jgi:hypothetical protein
MSTMRPAAQSHATHIEDKRNSNCHSTDRKFRRPSSFSTAWQDFSLSRRAILTSKQGWDTTVTGIGK